jgi:hypothetical protein
VLKANPFWRLVFMFAFGCGLIAALRIIQLEQALNDRTFLLIGLVFTASFFNMAVLWGLFGHWLMKLHKVLRAILIAPFAAFGNLACFILVFGIHYRLIEGQWNFEEQEGDWQHEAFSLVHDTIGLFIGTGIKYFLPWPLLAFAILALCLSAFKSSDVKFDLFA